MRETRLQVTVVAVLTRQEQADKDGIKRDGTPSLHFRTGKIQSTCLLFRRCARVGSSRRQPLTKCRVFSAGTMAVLLCRVETLEPVRAKVERRAPLCTLSHLIYVRFNQRAVSHNKEDIS